MRVLLTGSNGLVGNEMKSFLYERGDVDLVLFDRYEFDKNPDYLTLLISEKKFDAIVNAAGQSKVWLSKKDPISDLDSNIRFNVQLLTSNILVENGAFVYFGSDASVVRGQLSLLSPYAISKHSGVHYTKVLSKYYGYRSIILTPSFIVGERFSRNVLYDSLKAYLSGGLLLPKFHPESKWNFIDVKDVVATTYWYLEHDIGNVDVAIASKNDVDYGLILKILGFEPSLYKGYDREERCLRNTSHFNGFFNIHDFIGRYIER